MISIKLLLGVMILIGFYIIAVLKMPARISKQMKIGLYSLVFISMLFPNFSYIGEIKITLEVYAIILAGIQIFDYIYETIVEKKKITNSQKLVIFKIIAMICLAICIVGIIYQLTNGNVEISFLNTETTGEQQVSKVTGLSFSEIIDTIMTILTFFSVIGVFVTLKEMKKQRNAAYRPSIVFNPVTVSFKWDEFGNWLNIEKSSNIDIETQDETLVANVKMKIHCLLKAFTEFNIVNIGVGTAKNVVFSWSKDNLVRLQQYMYKHGMEKEKILTIGTESDVYTTNGSLVAMNKIDKNMLMLVLPNKENEYSLEIPPQYTIIINEAIRRNHLNEKVNPILDLRIKYQDIQGTTYSEVILVLIKRVMYELNEDGSGRAMYQLIPALPSEVVN